MLIVQHDRHVLRAATEVDADGDLHIFTSSSGLHLTPAEQDQLIQHLIEVRGAGRVQELLSGKWDGKNRRATLPSAVCCDRHPDCVCVALAQTACSPALATD